MQLTVSDGQTTSTDSLKIVETPMCTNPGCTPGILHVEATDEAGHNGFDRRLVGDVAPEERGTAAQRPDFIGQRRIIVQISHRHVGTCPTCWVSSFTG